MISLQVSNNSSYANSANERGLGEDTGGWGRSQGCGWGQGQGRGAGTENALKEETGHIDEDTESPGHSTHQGSGAGQRENLSNNMQSPAIPHTITNDGRSTHTDNSNPNELLIQ